MKTKIRNIKSCGGKKCGSAFEWNYTDAVKPVIAKDKLVIAKAA